MSRIKCRCGEIISTVQCPNNVQLRVYTDFEWDRIINMGMIDSLDIPMPQYDVIKATPYNAANKFSQIKLNA